MRNLYSRDAGSGETRRGSVASLSLTVNPMHAKYKGIVSTPGFCKFSAWKRETEIPKQSFSSWILGNMGNQPKNKIWMKDITTGRSETYATAKTHVERVVKGLSKLGVEKGSVVCMWTANFVEYWICCLAAWELGAAVMPVNCLIHTDKLATQLLETAAGYLVCDELNLDDALALKSKVSSIKHIILMDQDECAEDVLSFRKLMNTEENVRVSLKPVSLEKDPIYLIWTSIKDEPLLVEQTNRSLLAQMFSPSGTSNHWLDQNQSEVVFGGCWFFHTTGLYSFALSAALGLTLHVLSEYTDESLLAGLSDPSISTAILYSWQVRMLTSSPLVEKYDLSHLRLLVTGGSLLNQTVKNEVFEKHPNIKYVREAYGIKEAGLLTYTYPKDRAKQMMSKVEMPDDHLMPVGFPNMFTVFKVVDRVTGGPVSGPDMQGELCVKTCQLMIGYRGKEEKFLDSDGFFHTGDLGYYDKEGAIHFMEEISNLISFWMYEVSPSVLEARLLCHNSVVDAAVVGIQDKENGQLPRAFVVLKSGHEETEENLTNFLESRLQDHERLRGGLHYIQHIPRDENWKVRRSVLQKFIPPVKGEEGEAGQKTPTSSLQMDLPPVSPRARRASEAADALLNPAEKTLQYLEPQDVYGMRSRSRRGSRENILSSEGLEEKEEEKEEKKDIGGKEGEGIQGEEEELNYWLHVSVSTRYLEKQLLLHPGVSDVAIRGVEVQGVGQVPRAYVVLNKGFTLNGEDFACWANSKLSWHHRLFGGVVITDRLARDSSGAILVNLENLDKTVVAQQVFSDADIRPCT